MYYDYRDEFNQLIDLLIDVCADFRTFMNTFDSFVTLLTGWWQTLIGFLPQALWFLVLLVGIGLVLKLFFPRWRDV